MKLTGFGSTMVFLAGFLASSASMACSVAPFNETWSPSGTVEWVQNGNDCVLTTSVAAPRPSAAAVHYRRAERSAPFRISFVLALAPTLTSVDSTQSATLSSGTALAVPGIGPAQTSLYALRLAGGAVGTRPQLIFDAACASPQGVNGLCSGTLPFDLADLPLRITLELDMGVGDVETGQLRAWLGDDTSGAPALTLDNLDNARWGGIDRVSLGLSDVSPALATAIGSQPFTFSEIAVNELRLFWSDFESDRVGNIAVTGSQIGTGSSISGNTCNGQSQFPSIASGTTRLPGLTLVHPLTLGPSVNFAVQVIPSSGPLMAFACPAGSGPSGPCVSAVNAPGQHLFFPHLPAGDYQVVIGRTDGACGAYTLSPVGSPN